MKKDINVADLVASIADENADKQALKKTAGLASLKARMSGSDISKTAEDAQFVADAVAGEIGKETLSLSAQLEKVAQEMENAETTDDIIKIASELENSDLAHISTIASKMADVVFADLQNKLEA
jgi:hypothetical protein